jgi:hypothetical protein
MRDRFLQQEVWEKMGLSTKEVLPLVMSSPQRTLFQSMLFSKIVPNCKKLGLLDANDGWLRKRFTDSASSSSRTTPTPARSTTCSPSPPARDRRRTLLTSASVAEGGERPLVSLRPMSHRSDPRLLVLHGLRLKGVAGPDSVASATGLATADVMALLDELAALGLVERREGLLAGWTLTPAGRRGARPPGGRRAHPRRRPSTVEDGYHGFLRLNPGVLDACSRWQVRDVNGRMVRNDHGDSRYDDAVVRDLSTALRNVRPVGARLAEVLERFEPYAPQLEQAMEKVRSGDGDYVAKPVIPSFHTVWFEMHEDLLVTLGLDRSSEATEGAW